MNTRHTPHRTNSGSARSRNASASATDIKQYYLIAYNLVSAILWAAVLGRVFLLIPIVGFDEVYGGVGTFTKWTQTLALAEVVHSAVGLVRSPLPTTALQVISRLILVYPITDLSPLSDNTQTSMFYSTMLFAWSVTEIIRYSYFVALLQNLARGVPRWLSWLRYNTFFVLYPLGISSEMVLVAKASAAAGRAGWGGTQMLLWLALLVYFPGSYVLFTHMMAQRRKVIRGKARD